MAAGVANVRPSQIPASNRTAAPTPTSESRHPVVTRSNIAQPQRKVEITCEAAAAGEGGQLGYRAEP